MSVPSGGASEEGRRRRTLLWQRALLFVMTRAASGLQHLSRPASERFGTRLGDLGYLVAVRARRRADANVRLAYGDELSAAQRTQLVRDVFRHFGRGVVSFLRGPAMTRQGLGSIVTAVGWEHVVRAQEAGRGVILVTAHLGNWEILGRWLGQFKEIPLTVVAREPEQPAFAAYVRAMREGAGFAVLSKGASARSLLNTLRRGEVILLLADQNSGDVFTPFFGIPAGTVAGPAALALRTGGPIVPLYCLEQPDGSFSITCLPARDTQATGDNASDIARITTDLNRVLEGFVRAHPAQWLWIHNRWKSAFREENRKRAWTDDAGRSTALARWQGS